MDYDTDKIDEAVLALLSLTLHDTSEFGALALKDHDSDVLNRLYERGWIHDPATDSKSVVLNPESIKKSRQLFDQLFGKDN